MTIECKCPGPGRKMYLLSGMAPFKYNCMLRQFYLLNALLGGYALHIGKIKLQVFVCILHTHRCPNAMEGP